MDTVNLLSSSASGTLGMSSLVHDVSSDHGHWMFCIAAVLLVLVGCAIITNLSLGLTVATSILVVEEQSLRTSCRRH